MYPINLTGVNAGLVVTHNNFINKIEASVNANATAGLFLQVFDSNVVPAEGAVPIKWWPADQTGFKTFDPTELPLAIGCYICLSTTGPTKTIATGGSDLFDGLLIEVDHRDYLSAAVIGTNTPVFSYVTGTVSQRLLNLFVTNLENATRYLQSFYKAAPINGDVPVCQWTVSALGTQQLNFGITGAGGIDTQNNTRFFIALSTTPATLTLASGAGMTARFDTLPNNT